MEPDKPHDRLSVSWRTGTLGEWLRSVPKASQLGRPTIQFWGQRSKNLGEVAAANPRIGKLENAWFCLSHAPFAGTKYPNTSNLKEDVYFGSQFQSTIDSKAAGHVEGPGWGGLLASWRPASMGRREDAGEKWILWAILFLIHVFQLVLPATSILSCKVPQSNHFPDVQHRATLDPCYKFWFPKAEEDESLSSEGRGDYYKGMNLLVLCPFVLNRALKGLDSGYPQALSTHLSYSFPDLNASLCWKLLHKYVKISAFLAIWASFNQVDT